MGSISSSELEELSSGSDEDTDAESELSKSDSEVGSVGGVKTGFVSMLCMVVLLLCWRL